MKAPGCLALALSLTAWPVPLPKWDCSPTGRRVAYLGYRRGEVMALGVEPVEVGPQVGAPCRSGTAAFDPTKRLPLTCFGGSFVRYPGVNTILIVESGVLEDLP